ncbi:uncharacterized protein LOC118792559 isoform X2 [Megalops cyprinoides]|uniref:uncharacterized protein LOC118792559 isoform X2 n=1 Tax=Megalops cyprinoides TaxID=118141 RepID=UPI001864BA88|nr:uncharacterized protein LOC118792559 isoform X2 [Megalops cyprinoides]
MEAKTVIIVAILSTAARSAEVFKEQHNVKIISLKWGDSLTIQCSTTKDNYDGLYLLGGLDEDTEVFFLYKKSKKLTIGKKYSSRVKTEGEVNKLTITIANMTEDDSGVYWCKYRYLNEETGNTDRAEGNGSRLVVVRGAYKPCPDGDGTPAMTLTLVTVTAISAGSVFRLCVVIIFIWVVPRIKMSRQTSEIHALHQVLPIARPEDTGI